MPVAAIVAAAGIAGGASLGAGALQSSAASNAASLEAQSQANSLAFQENELNTEQAASAPYLASGNEALNALDTGMGLQPTTSPSGQSLVSLQSLLPGTSSPMVAPSLTPGTSNVSQATYQQDYQSAADDIVHSVQSGYLTQAQGEAALQSLQSEESASGVSGSSGKVSQAEGDALQGIETAENAVAGLTSAPTPTTGNVNSSFLSPSTAGWEPGALETGSTLADSAIQSASGTNPLSNLAGGSATSGVAQAAPPNTSFGTANTNTNGSLAASNLAEQWNTPFTAPTAAQAAATPGEQFELQQGEQAMQNSAAAQGNLLTGNTEASLNNYAQNEASTYYQQAYNNALTQYQQAYNIFNNNQTGEYNKLASMTGQGQTAASQLNSAASNAASLNANTNLTGAAQQASQLNNAAAASASGYVGAGNAASGAAGSLSLLSALNNIAASSNNTSTMP